VIGESFEEPEKDAGAFGAYWSQLSNNFFLASLALASAEVTSGSSGGGWDEEAPLLDSAVGSSGISSMLMKSFGFGATEEVALGGTSTSGVIGIEADERLDFFLGFLGDLLPELLLHNKKEHNT
jgi:hypothetical protein